MASLESQDAEWRKVAYSLRPKEIQLLDELILLVNHGLGILTGTQNDRSLNFLINLLLVRSFNSLWRARQEIISGYPAECLTLCRAALEHWVTVIWVENHPDATNRWLWAILEEVEQPPKQIPTTNQMLTDELGELSGTFLEMYNALSKFAHARGIGLRWLVHLEGGMTQFHAGSRITDEELTVCLFFCVYAAQAHLLPVARLQDRVLGSVDEAWMKRAAETNERARAFIQSVQEDVLKKAQPRQSA